MHMDESNVYAVNHKYLSKKLWVILFATLGCFVFVLGLDVLNGTLCGMIKSYIWGIGSLEHAKDILISAMDDFGSLAITVNAVLAAAVIFFYSVQDNRKEGLPRRTILDYSFGSSAIQIWFIICLFLLPVNLFCNSFGLQITAFLGICVSYFYQCVSLILIFLSTSHGFSVVVLCRSEIRQFNKLKETDYFKENGKYIRNTVEGIQQLQFSRT